MKKFFLPILIFAVGISAAVFIVSTKPQSDAAIIKEQEWVVDVVAVQPENLSPHLVLYGRVESPRTATLRVPSLNFITEVKTVTILEGQHVQKGDVLIRLDEKDTELKLKQHLAEIADIAAQIDTEKQNHSNNLAAIAHEKSLLKLAEKALTRASQLQKRQVSSEAALDQAHNAVEQQKLVLKNRENSIKNHSARLAQLQARLDRAKAVLEATQLELERTKITAPFSGIIATVSVAVGDSVRSGDTLLSLYDTKDLEVRAQVPNRYRGQIIETLAENQTRQTQIKIGTQIVKLQLDRVSGQVNSKSGGIDCFFRVIEGENILRLGQFITLPLLLPEQHNVIALPFEAVYGTDRIYKLVDGRMHKIIIEQVGEMITNEGESKILVRTPDLHAGEHVITTQLPNAMNGLKVKAQNPISLNSSG